MLNLEKIGKKISTKRKELKMTQNGLAESLYVTHQAVSKWENGKSIPTIDLLYALTKILHISIDFLLDDSDISKDDYETLFRQYPRASVIKKFLDQSDPNKEIDKIFYLLTKEERKTLMDLMITKRVVINVESIWHLLSKNERAYLLTIILTCKYDYDLNQLNHQFTQIELQIINKHIRNGIYPYHITYKKGVIL